MKCLIFQENQKSFVNTLEQTKKLYEKNVLEKDAELKEINNIKQQLEHQMDEIQVTIESLQFSLTFEKNR